MGFPWCCYQLCRSAYVLYQVTPWFRFICMVICCSQAILVTFLNFYWYKFIIKKLLRMFITKEVQSNDIKSEDPKTK